MGDMGSTQRKVNIVDMWSDACYVGLTEFRARQDYRCRLVNQETFQGSHAQQAPDLLIYTCGRVCMLACLVG